MMFWFVLSLIKVSDCRHLSQLRIPVFGCPNRGCGTLLTVPRVWLFVFGKDSAPSGRKNWSVLAMNSVFRICSRINIFYDHAFYRNPGHYGSLYDHLLDSMAREQSFDDKAVFVFVGDVNARHSEWLESVSPTDQHRPDILNFFILSCCEQLVRCPTHIAGNRLDLVMTDVPDIVDVLMDTPLGTSDHCIVRTLCASG